MSGENLIERPLHDRGKLDRDPRASVLSICATRYRLVVVSALSYASGRGSGCDIWRYAVRIIHITGTLTNTDFRHAEEGIEQNGTT
jgi:hypothetical protein